MIPRRKMSWLLILWTAAFAAWAIAAGAGANCNDQTGSYADAAKAGCQAGTGIGIALIIVLWFLGFVVLALVWFMTRPRGRPCPRCGEHVQKGRMECKSCHYDFRQIGQSESAVP